MTCDPEPTLEAGAAAVSMVTVRPVVTLAALCAVWSILVGLAVDVTSGPGLPRGTQTPPAGRVTRCVILTVTHLGAALAEGASLTLSVAAGAMVTWRTGALAGGRVAGRSVHAVALQLAEGPVEPGGAVVFTQMPIVPGPTPACPRHPVTCPVVTATASQLTPGAKRPLGALCVTVLAPPAQTTRTVSRHRLTQSSVAAVTAVGAVCTEPAWGAAVAAVLPSPPGATHTAARHCIAVGPRHTHGHQGTVAAVAPGRAGDVAVCSYEPCWAVTRPRGWFALAAIFTLALPVAVRSVPAMYTLLVTSGPIETGGAVTQTGHRVAELVGF